MYMQFYLTEFFIILSMKIKKLRRSDVSGDFLFRADDVSVKFFHPSRDCVPRRNAIMTINIE